jgi:hypothetical protein
VNRAVESWRDLAGVRAWRLFEVRPDRLRHVTVDGAEANFAAHVALAAIGDTLIELVQPAGGASPFQALLDTRGEGVGWLGLASEGRYEDLAAHCTQVGYRLRMEGSWVGHHPSAWFASRDFIGTDIEILGPDATASSLLAETPPDRVVEP